MCPASLFQRDRMLLQIARCSVHHSGALLLEGRDGEFLDAQLCSTSVAASNQLQQPEAGSEAAHPALDGAQEGHDRGVDSLEAFENDYDDGGGGGADDGDDYMHQEAGDQHDMNMPGQLYLAMTDCHSAVQHHTVCKCVHCNTCQMCSAIHVNGRVCAVQFMPSWLRSSLRW